MDSREKTRYRLNLPVEVSWIGKQGSKERCEGQTRDISSRGVYIIAGQQPPAGTVVGLDVTLPRVRRAVRVLRIHAKGRVVRVGCDEPSTGEAGFAVESQSTSLRRRTLQAIRGKGPIRRAGG